MELALFEWGGLNWQLTPGNCGNMNFTKEEEIYEKHLSEFG